MKVDRSKAEESLTKKGFIRCKSKSHHDHIFYYYKYKGKRTRISTHFSHSRKKDDISGDLLTSMRRQLGLDKNKDAIDLLECPMSADDYNEILKKKGILTK